MIVQEIIEISGTQYDHTFSDAGYMIERDGVLYADAIDPKNSGRVYTETDIPIESEPREAEATVEDYLTALNELGVNTDEEDDS